MNERSRAGGRRPLAVMLALAATGCDLTAWIPLGDARRHTVTAFEVGGDEDIQLHASATVRLGTLQSKFNRLVLKSRCTLAGERYIDAGWVPLQPLKSYPPGATASIAEMPFSAIEITSLEVVC